MTWTRISGAGMAEAAVRSRSPIEAFVAATLAGTWLFYLLGALYLVGPVLGWALGGLALASWYLGPAMAPGWRATGAPPLIIWIWVGGALALLLALWVGHLDWGLGPAKTLKSTIGWAKGWALLPLFLLAGAVLPIRRAGLIRAHCVLGAMTLAITPFLVVAPYLGAPSLIFVSPLQAVGGPGPEYFAVYLYTLDPANWTPRWQFYAPWSPFAGLLGVIMVLFALEEPRRAWATAGVAAGVAMVALSKSRMSMAALMVCAIGPRLAPLLLHAYAWRLAAAACVAFAFVGGALIDGARQAISAFKSARADSTRVRETLQRIAEERWRADAYWFGHGAVHPGPHLVEYMPIGSHHTWYGLLFVKGVVGFWAFLTPLVCHVIIAFIDAVRAPRGRLPLGLLLVFVALSFGENIEIQAYLLWPAVLMLGVHAREMAERGGAGRRAA